MAGALLAELQLPPHLGELAAAQARVAGWLRPLAPSARAAYAVDLVLEEMLSNIVRHGGPHGSIGVQLWLDGRRLAVHLLDDGPPFDPTQAEDAVPATSLAEARTGGRGVFLTRRMSQGMRYAREGGRNRLVLDFDLD